MLNPNNYENFKPFLTETERKKLEALKEDDNPCLLKLYFKECKRLHDSILSIISVSSTFASLNLNR